MLLEEKTRYFLAPNSPNGKLTHTVDGKKNVVDQVTGFLSSLYIREFAILPSLTGDSDHDDTGDNATFIKKLVIVLEDTNEEYHISIGLGTFVATNVLNSLLTLPKAEENPKIIILSYRTKDKNNPAELSKYLTMKVLFNGRSLKWKYTPDEISKLGNDRISINEALLQEFNDQRKVTNNDNNDLPF